MYQVKCYYLSVANQCGKYSNAITTRYDKVYTHNFKSIVIPHKCMDCSRFGIQQVCISIALMLLSIYNTASYGVWGG